VGRRHAGFEDAENRSCLTPRLALGEALSHAFRFACGATLLIPAVNELALVSDAHELLQVFVGSVGRHAQDNVAQAAEASAFRAGGGDGADDEGAAFLGVQVNRADDRVE
jgi:hypothetical protein